MGYLYDYQSDDPYCYPGTKVLINKLNITDAEQLFHAERRLTSLRLAELSDNPAKGRFNFEHLCAIHRHIFGDIYDWAGEIRKGEFLIKDKTIFCLGRHIDSYANGIFTDLSKANKLRGLKKEEFIDQLAYFMGEVNSLHPFREGNGRVAREFFRQLAHNAGYDLDFSKSDKDNLLQADIAAFNRAYQLLTYILRDIVKKR
jgi:cell filamentation protein